MWNLLPLLLTAGGTVYQNKVQQDAEARRLREAEAGRRQLQIKQREADQRVNAEIDRVKGSTPEDERASAQAAFMEQLRRNKANAVSSSGVGGERYREGIAGASDDVDQFGRTTADTMARIAAPQRQRENEGVSFNRAATDVNAIARFAQGDDFLTQLRMANIKADPTKMALGQIATGIGGGMADSGFGMPKTPMYDTPGTPAYARTHYDPNKRTPRTTPIKRPAPVPMVDTSGWTAGFGG